MRRNSTARALDVGSSGVLVVDGYGIRLRVQHGHLLVSDGIGRQRRELRIPRPAVGLRRLVLYGHTGSLTLEAIRWLTDLEVGLVHVDADGKLLIASAGLGLDDPRLRRAQALAFGQPAGMAVARWLLDAKLKGQRRVARQYGGDVSVIDVALSGLGEAATVDQLMVVEAAAAKAYWETFAGTPLRFPRNQVGRLPEHWLTLGTRMSPMTSSPRTAVNPANAVLNYLYALLEAEARLACLAMGLDPGMGVLHADQRARDSLALDVMEAVRPDADAWVLQFFEQRVVRQEDFVQTRQGVCRVLPPLTHELAGTIPTWGKLVAPIVEHVARMFFAAPTGSRDVLPTRLTQMKRRAGRGVVRPATPVARVPRAAQAPVCVECGAPTERSRTYCDACLPEQLAAGVKILSVAGPRALAALRTEGRDPAHGGEVEQKRSAARRKRLAEEASWDGDPSLDDPETFRREILPRLQDVSLNRMAAATGLTKGYLSFVRRGRYVPHPRWWEVLGAVATEAGAPTN